MNNGQYAVRRKTRLDEGRRRQMLAERAERRLAMISEASEELGDAATFERVARRTGIPLGFLHHFFETVEEMRSVRPPTV